MRGRREQKQAPGYAWLDPVKLWILGSCLGSAFYAYQAVAEADSGSWFNAAFLAASAIIAATLRAVF
jgi:hypothetical protein